MDETTLDALQPLTEKIVREFKPQKIILFGSWAWGKPEPNSDVDLFIVKESSKSTIEMIRDINTIIFDRTIGMDILVYTPDQVERRKELGDPFIWKIISSGKVIYDHG